MVAHDCNPSYSGGSQFEASLRKIVRETLSQNKNFTKKMAGGVVRGVGTSITKINK
jgi:hypothetical protein